MKFDILEKFKAYVYEHTESKNTAKQYYGAVKKLFEGMQFNSLKEISQEQIETQLSKVKGQSNFSSAKQGLKLLKQFDPNLNIPDETYFIQTAAHKRNHRKKQETIYIGKTKRKINQLQDPKLKIAYRLALISGLRVSELEALEPRDITFTDNNRITINVRHGKGDKQRTVECIEDKYVYSGLQNLIANTRPGEKIFWSDEKMRQDASNLNMECHDLRRIYAYQHKKGLKKSGHDNYHANRVLQSNLGHTRYKTTKRYLYGKKIIE